MIKWYFSVILSAMFALSSVVMADREAVDFSSEAIFSSYGWVARNMRAGNDFGFSNTNNAGGMAAGELGGTVSDSDIPISTCLDETIGTVTGEDFLYACGKIKFKNINFSGWWYFGWSKEADGSGSNDHLIGIRCEEKNGGLIMQARRQLPLSGGSDGDELEVDNGVYDFSLLYNPNGGTDGDGMITFTIGDQVSSRFVPAEDKPTELDRFGLLTRDYSDAVEQVEIYIDDLVYTSYDPVNASTSAPDFQQNDNDLDTTIFANTPYSVTPTLNPDVDPRPEDTENFTFSFVQPADPGAIAGSLSVADDGTVTWTDPSLNHSPLTIELQADNGVGQDTLLWIVTLSQSSVAPEIEAIPDQQIVEEYPFQYQGVLLAGNDGTTFALDAASETLGMMIEPDTGLITWLETNTDNSPHTITITASNPSGSDSESFTLTVDERLVSNVLNDGQGDFDPWNQTRWAPWYNNGKIAEPFEIDCSLTFAERGDAWRPDMSNVGELFTITEQGIDIDGNDLIIDVRNSGYLNRTLDQVYSGGQSEWDLTEGGARCFSVALSFAANKDDTRLHNFTLKGFKQAIRTYRDNSHPIQVYDVLFTRNCFGMYFSGSAATVSDCQFYENARGGFYSGSDSNHNNFINNSWRDNNYVLHFAYADMIFDTAYGNLAEYNNFLPSNATKSHFRVAMSFYRNQGEDGKIREDAPHDNMIRYNTVNSYSLGVDLAARHGRGHSHDASGEGRDHVSYNLFKENTFINSDIGIKVNTPHNTIEGNTFTNVNEPIVLHCVFYNLIETTINDQAGDDVRFWWIGSDYSSYASWFPYQDDLNGSIPQSEKLIHVRTDYGAPNFPSPGSGTFIHAPTLLKGNDYPDADLGVDRQVNILDLALVTSQWLFTLCEKPDFCIGADLDQNSNVDFVDLHIFSQKWLVRIAMMDTYSTGGTPIDIAVGDFYENSPGDEVAVIWDEPISRIDNTDYYSIIIYDSRGTEIDRCGRTTNKWQAITAGNFQGKPGEEIAAVHSEPVAGKYPVYFFRRGYQTEYKTLLPENSSKIRTITAGNFKTTDDNFDEVALILEEDPDRIMYIKPNDNDWIRYTQNVEMLSDIAAGNFDGNQNNGDEVAGIGFAGMSSSLVACWNFETGNGGPLADKAPDGEVDDDLTILGTVTIANGKATITNTNAGACRAADSIDLDLNNAFTIWVRAKVLNEPTGFISLVNKRRFSDPEERAYGFYLRETNAPCSDCFSLGGQISADGDNGSNSFSTDPRDGQPVPIGVYREMVMRSSNTIQVDWLASTVANPASETEWETVNGPTSSGSVSSIYNSSVEFYAGNSGDLNVNTATIEYDEIKIYNKHLSLSELAAIEPSAIPADTGQYPIYFYRPDDTGYYATAASQSPSAWTAIGAGDFDGSPSRDEVAVASASFENGSYAVKYFVQGENSAFKISDQDVCGVPAQSLDRGELIIKPEISDYERIDGFTDGNYATYISGWGNHVVVLPSLPQTTSIPLFWLNTNPDNDNEKHLRVTPLVR